jgi:phospholipase D1/2
MLLITTAGMLLGPVLGFIYALAGSLASAALLFLIGRQLGKDGVRRLAGRRLYAIGRRLARNGIGAVILVRLAPVAPYSVVNLVAGVSQLRLRDFLIGTGLGMAPGTAALVVFGDQLEDLLKRPDPDNILALALIAAALVLGAFALLRWSRRRSG